MILIHEMTEKDIDIGFLECLKALSDPKISLDDAKMIFIMRAAQGIVTYTATDWKNEEPIIVGTASLLIEQKYLHGGRKVAHIEDVSVREDCHGQGIGKALIEYLIDEAKQAKCYKIILNCDLDIKEFYEKCGFHQHGITMRLDL